jgi:LPS sulfotransferase NodH
VAEPVRVLYLIGWGRSGSTLLANILGEIEGFFAAGELHYLWERSLIEGRRCGCGEPIRACPVWSIVIERLDLGETLDPRAVVGWLNDALRIRHTPGLLRMRRGAPLHPPALASYGDLLQRLYAAIADVTGARVIVDPSKLPADAGLLRLLPNVDPYFVQLVRDPRAVAWSWQRPKVQGDPNAPEMMRTHGTLASAANWNAFNVAAERLASKVGPRRFLRLRYEDLVAAPRATVAMVADFAGERDPALPFSDERTAVLTPNHTVSGNPDRFRSGPVTLRDDREWLEQQDGPARWCTTALTLPLAIRYGYPVRPTSSSASA